MIESIVFWAKVITTFLLLLVTFLFWVACFLPGAVLKLVVPLAPVRSVFTAYLVWIATNWVGTNHQIFRLMHGAPSNRLVDPEFDARRSWLVVGNHQSWADILILADALHGRAPFPRFFLKRQLLWVPFVGIVCWSLDMPFMKRHSAKALAENPALRGQDLETTRRACQGFRGTPVTVVNYLEGTRFTPAKRDAMQSPYRHLLKPKSAGLSFALHAMGDQFAGVVDLSIAYAPTRHAKVWSFLGGEQTHAYVHARLRRLPADLANAAADDVERAKVKAWVATLWSEKDAELDKAARALAPRQPLRPPPRPQGFTRA